MTITTNQISAGVRYLSAIAGTIIVMLGLQTKGIYVEQVKGAIEALGNVASSIVTAAAAITAIIATMKGMNAASPTNQAIALEKTGAVIVGSAELAAATPDSPNIVSHADVSVVSKTTGQGL